MYLKQILEWILIVVVIVEVLIPGTMGRPLFPILRRHSKASILLAEQERLKMQLEEDRLQQEVANLKQLHENNMFGEKEKKRND